MENKTVTHINCKQERLNYITKNNKIKIIIKLICVGVKYYEIAQKTSNL